MTNTEVPTGITVAVGSDARRAQGLAATLATAYDVAVTTVHVELDAPAGPAQTSEEALAVAIAERVPDHDLLIIESEHADRWRSRHSVAEHLIDAHRNATVVLGPSSVPELSDGPVVVALDGSVSAQAGLAAAQRLAIAVDRALVLARVIPEHLHAAVSNERESITVALEREAATINASAAVIESNDPVSALVQLCTEHRAAFIALASSGDRETERSTMSRTAAGLIAEAPCPVFVTRSAPR